MSDLVGNPEDRFSHNEAQLDSVKPQFYMTKLGCTELYISSLKGQGSGKVKFGLVAEIYEFSVCFRIIYLMVKNVFFYLFNA